MDGDDDNKIPIDELKAKSGVSDSQLDQKCSVEHLNKVALYVKNDMYSNFADSFNLPKDLKSDIDNNPDKSFHEKIEAVFQWWSNNVENATYRKFLQICSDLSEEDIAIRMYKLCSKGKIFIF